MYILYEYALDYSCQDEEYHSMVMEFCTFVAINDRMFQIFSRLFIQWVTKYHKYNKTKFRHAYPYDKLHLVPMTSCCDFNVIQLCQVSR